jgi:DNA repair exonuclease SbcCD nuclease subunit
MSEPIKVLTIGDPHFKVGNIVETDEMVDKLLKIVEHIKPKFIVVLGDILHTHEKIHVIPLMRAEKLIRLLSEQAPTFVIVGNHDRPNNSVFCTDEHPYNSFKQWKNTYVVDDVTEATIGGYRFIFAPYVPPSTFEMALSRLKPVDNNNSEINNPENNNPENNNIKTILSNTKAIFCHQEFYGAKMGMIESKAGDVWPEDYPLVISGHVHDYDRLQKNLIYVGTPMQHAFGDKEDKTISIYTFTDDNWEEDRIDIGLKKRIIVYLTPEKIHTYEPPEDKLVKIVIRGDEAEIKAVGKLEKIKELRKAGINVVLKVSKNEETNQKRVGPTLKLKYKDRLYVEIQKDEEQLKWFNKLFKNEY